jgi:hypothetical protein
LEGVGVTAVEIHEEHLAVLAHKLLGTLCLIADKAEFLREHRNDVATELCDAWLTDIHAHAHEVATQLSLFARGLTSS